MTLSVQELESMCEGIALQRQKIEELRKLKSQEDQKLEEMELKMIETLRALGKENYQSNFGTVYTIHKVSYRVPKLPEEKQAFFEYLRSKGVYDDLITVNSNTLNSFCREQFELAKQSGDPDFSIPGLQPPEVYETLGLRK